MDPVFLSVEQVENLHAEGIRLYGGSHGLRDRNALESAVMAPQASFGGELLNSTMEEFAASHWLSLTMNHPFVDGNKRAALWACSTFLNMNGYALDLSELEAETVTLEIAKGIIRTKEQLVTRFRIVVIT